MTMRFYRIVILPLILILIYPNQGNTQQQFQANGTWRTYLSHGSGNWSVKQGENVYTITRGGVSVYNIAENSINTLSTVDGLSSIDPSTIYKDPSSGRVFIGYTDGSINYFSDHIDIGSLTDIRRSTTFTRKGIRDFVAGDGRLFTATDFGIQIFNLESLAPISTVSKIGLKNQPALEVLSVGLSQGRVWAAMGSKGLYSAPISSPNLSDPSIWVQEDTLNGFPEESINEVTSLGDEPYVLSSSKVYVLKDTGWAVAPRLDRQFEYLDVQDGYISAGRFGYFISYSEGVNNVRTVNYSGGSIEHALITDDVAYVADLFSGVRAYDYEPRSFRDITPDGPTNNKTFRIAAGNGEFYIAPRGHDETGVPIADASGIYHYNGKEGKWTILNRDNGGLSPDRTNDKFARALYDPKTRTAYLGSWGNGLAILRDGELLETFKCDNSALNLISKDTCDPRDNSEARVSGMALDSKGDLWVSLSLARNPLVVRRGDDSWESVNGRRFPSGNFFDLLIDDFDTKWMQSRLGGLYLFNENGDLNDQSDDAILNLRAGAGQGDLQAVNTRSFAKDKDGYIWIGTDKGITVFYEVFSLSQGTIVDGACPAFERRCLLRDEQINAIAVDGGNRKWIGTSNGVFLISPEGDELLQQFTQENSPLISDLIYDIAIDGSTGEIFFATDKGTISYQGDATEASQNCDQVVVYPSPVLPEYEGLITIRGAAANSTVRITSVSGLLVKEIESQGGTATWDGRDVYGNKVSSGIYLAIISDDEGEKGCVGKFSIIR
ncbi:MAG: two-component regulator propeller domain-containing protein [Bacteroidia bacterium]